MYECPNCREPQPVRYVMKPLWGTWTCAACGAVMGIDVKRRVIAVGCVLAVCMTVMFVLEWRGMMVGRGNAYLGLATLASVGLVIVYFVDRAVLIQRTGKRCGTCGYDLRGQIAERCPECGVRFDPAERRAEVSAEDRMRRAAMRRRARVLGVVIIVALGLAFMFGNILWYRYMRQVRSVPPPVVAPTSPTH